MLDIARSRLCFFADVHAVDEVALQFVRYAQALKPSEEIQYQYWIDQFRQVASALEHSMVNSMAMKIIWVIYYRRWILGCLLVLILGTLCLTISQLLYGVLLKSCVM
jgi:hypothetical protein